MTWLDGFLHISVLQRSSGRSFGRLSGPDAYRAPLDRQEPLASCRLPRGLRKRLLNEVAFEQQTSSNQAKRHGLLSFLNLACPRIVWHSSSSIASRILPLFNGNSYRIQALIHVEDFIQIFGYDRLLWKRLFLLHVSFGCRHHEFPLRGGDAIVAVFA